MKAKVKTRTLVLDNEEELSDELRERTISIFKGKRQIFLLIKYLKKIQKIILNGLF